MGNGSSHLQFGVYWFITLQTLFVTVSLVYFYYSCSLQVLLMLLIFMLLMLKMVSCVSCAIKKLVSIHAATCEKRAEKPYEIYRACPSQLRFHH